MNAEEIRTLALSFPQTTECFPFDEFTLVFKVEDKIFLLVSLDAQPLRFNAKAEPEKALEWRDHYPENILPGYHMNKKYWNTIVGDNVLKQAFLREIIFESYLQVVSGLPKKKREPILVSLKNIHSGETL